MKLLYRSAATVLINMMIEPFPGFPIRILAFPDLPFDLRQPRQVQIDGSSHFRLFAQVRVQTLPMLVAFR